MSNFKFIQKKSESIQEEQHSLQIDHLQKSDTKKNGKLFLEEEWDINWLTNTFSSLWGTKDRYCPAHGQATKSEESTTTVHY